MPGRSEAERSAPSIYQVAHEAGVSVSTVSRAFSRPGRVNAETAARIRDIATRMGYRTNPLARGLLTGRTSVIALMIADITNPYYFEIIRGAQAAASAAGYTMLLADAQESDRQEREALDRATDLVEGIVLTSTRMSDLAIRMTAKLRPVVVLNRVVAELPCVVTDHSHGVQVAVDHLIGLGHSRVTYLSGPEASWANGVRWQALHEVAAEFGLRVQRIGPYPPTVAGGVAAAGDFCQRPTSAVIAYNDLVALGFLRGLADLGVKVPRDVSVIGFDNIFGTDLVDPALTTVAAPQHTLGVTAVRHLLRLIDGGSPETAEPKLLPTKLIVRRSTAPYRRRRKPAAFGHPAPAGSESAMPPARHDARQGARREPDGRTGLA